MKKSEIEVGVEYAMWKGNDPLPPYGVKKVVVVDKDATKQPPRRRRWDPPVPAIEVSFPGDPGEPRDMVSSREIKMTWADYRAKLVEQEKNRQQSEARERKTAAFWAERNARVVAAVRERVPGFGRGRFNNPEADTYEVERLLSGATEGRTSYRRDDFSISTAELEALLGLEPMTEGEED